MAGVLLAGCHQKTDPDALYRSIYGDYLHGDLELARERATGARSDFFPGGRQPDAHWGLQFQVLEAEILLKEDQTQEALAILTLPGTAVPSGGDLAIKYDLLFGLVHARVGYPLKSEQEMHAARRLAEASRSPLIAEVLRYEGQLALDAGRNDQADGKFRDSLGVARRTGDALLQASDLVDLGEDSLESGHFDQALALLRAAADIAQTVQARRQLQLATGNMGWAYHNLGDFERALAQFQEAEQLAQQIGMTRNRTRWLQDAGLTEYRLGDLDAARRYEEQALQLLLTGSAGASIDRVTYVETDLALLLHEQGQDPAAKRYIESAVLRSRDAEDRNLAAYVGFVRGLLAGRGGGTEDAEQTLLTAGKVATDPDLQSEIQAALADLYATRHLPQQAQLWYERAIQTVETKRAAVSDEALQLSAFGYAVGAYREYADFLVSLQRPDDALAVLDRSRARTLEEGLGFSAGKDHTLETDGADSRSVARKLNATVLFYALGSKQSYLWAITAHETRLFVLPASRDIQSQIEAYQKAILKSEDPIRAATPVAVSLYRTLIGPAAALIPAGSKVFLVPDGVLNTLNFETLLAPTAGGFRYWIEDVTVTSASSIRMLAHLKDPGAHRAARELLLIGNPVAATTGFEALPNAAIEVQRVAQHFSPGSQTVLTQTQAVPAAYAQSGPEQYRYIHFVAHGTASRLSPLDSAVVLSAPAGRPDDFKLYAHDILLHPLHAELVTISTCYGSGVRAYAGEGLVGLAWVFLRAGSHNVIGALWEADDASTPLLMDQLYAGLRAGKAPDVALHDAKLSLIHATSVYRKPFYWAPFQLYAGS